MSRISSVNRDTLIFHADSIPDTLKAKTDYRSFYSPVKIIEKAVDRSTESSQPTEPGDVEKLPGEPVEPSEPTDTTDPPTESKDSETEQLIENPEPAVPSEPEDTEEVPADSTGS